MARLRPPIGSDVLSPGLLLLPMAIIWGLAPGSRECESSPAPNTLRLVAPSQANARLQTPETTGRIVVKFAEDSDVTVAPWGLSGDAAKTSRLQKKLAEVAPGATVLRRFTTLPEECDARKRQAEIRSGRVLASLNRYGVLDGIRVESREGLIGIVRKLVADPAIETAFLEPVLSPLGETVSSRITLLPATTPDFSDSQGYRLSAPVGVGAVDVVGIPGADGSGVQVVDIEGAWLWTHEDLPAPFAEIGAPWPDLGWRSHGTMVMGIIRGVDNGFGMTGIAPAAQVGGASIYTMTSAEAMEAAIGVLDPGDVMLIELHGAGPLATGAGTVGYVPLEFWQDNFDVIQLATALGIVVVEGGGNGYHDLDDPDYEGLFNRQVRDSGAILVGASNGPSLDPASFTNTGSRMDVHAWGGGVATTGGGTLQGPPSPETEWYTDGFSGTSSASAIVAGVTASLQGAVKAAYGFPLDSYLMRAILADSGTPQNPGPTIGPRPDLLAAWTQISTGVGQVVGTVTEAGTGTPIEGATVRAGGTTLMRVTDAAGDYALPLVAGSHTLRFDSFFHQTVDLPATVAHDSTTTVDASMTPKPTFDLVARARSRDFSLLPGVRVTPLDMPIPAGITGPDGTVHFGPVPGGNFRLLFDGLAGYGAGYRELTVAWEGSPPASVEIGGWLEPAFEDFESDDGGFLSAQGIWTHGAPAAGGPTGGFSGTQCWGVGMTGNYPDAVKDSLWSGPFSFASESPTALFMSLHYWSETEDDYDGVTLDVGNIGAFGLIMVPREPMNGYTHNFLAGLAIPGAGDLGANGWAGSTGEWRGAVFDLSDKIPFTFYLRFRFGSDSGVNGEGFWIDDITFDTGADPTIGITPGEAPSPLALAVFPNPSPGPSTLAWRVPGGGQATLGVFDVRGRRLRTVIENEEIPESGTLRWDGTDDAGRRLPSGVYWFRLSRGEDLRIRKIVLSP